MATCAHPALTKGSTTVPATASIARSQPSVAATDPIAAPPPAWLQPDWTNGSATVPTTAATACSHPSAAAWAPVALLTPASPQLATAHPFSVLGGLSGA